jgi:WD40 repeat protein
VVSPHGTKVYATGWSGGINPRDYGTVAYDAATGDELWVSRYPDTGVFSNLAYAIGVSPDGSKVFVTGEAVGPVDYDYATVAYDAATGGELWVARYDSMTGVEAAYSLAVSPDGTEVFVTGWSAGSSTVDYATVAYDTASGTQQWVARYSKPGSSNTAYAVGVSPDGTRVFVTGTSNTSGSEDYATIAYDAATGVSLWLRRYNSGGGDQAYSLGMSPDGTKVFVTGWSGGGLGLATIAYDAETGARQWLRRATGSSGSVYPSPPSLGVSPDGTRVVVAGTGQGFSYDYLAVAYDTTTGNRLWKTQFGRKMWNEYAYSLGISPDGATVFVTGNGEFNQNGVKSDYVTAAFNMSTGSLLWVSRYDGPLHDQDGVYSLGVSPDGTKIFVTGGDDGVADYATVAYSTS